MRKQIFFLAIPVFFLGLQNVQGQRKQAGPVIHDFGEVWKVKELGFRTDTTKVLKAVFDIMDSPEDPKALNPKIETVARFLNVHAQCGIPEKNLKAALVIHNKATKDILADKSYLSRYGTRNPNSELIGALLSSGVKVILCGQSSHSREIPIDESIEGVQLALSAMTALIQLQDEGYPLIKF